MTHEIFRVITTLKVYGLNPKFTEHPARTTPSKRDQTLSQATQLKIILNFQISQMAFRPQFWLNDGRFGQDTAVLCHEGHGDAAAGRERAAGTR